MANKQHRVTSADVARASGVSRATVSYVLNNDPRQTIPDETRVWSAKTRHEEIEVSVSIDVPRTVDARACNSIIPHGLDGSLQSKRARIGGGQIQMRASPRSSS